MVDPLLQVESLFYSYPDGRSALNGASLRLEGGQRVALLGPNGAGKTTLALHLNGVLRASSGRVLVEGVEISDSTVGEVRKKVGLVFQDANDQLFMPTVEQDVGFGPANLGLSGAELKARVEAALAAVGALDLIGRVPHHLSGGEKRVAAIATALAMKPELLVLDEPGSGLDPLGRRELIATLKSLPIAQVVITHDLPLALELCPRAVVMDQGQVVADLPTDRLVRDPGMLAAHRLELPFGFRLLD